MQKPDDFIREIRINPLVEGESVLVATERSLRPLQQRPQSIERDSRHYVPECPFCRGNEASTPSTVTAIPAEPEWELRVVENLYPMVRGDLSHPPVSFGLQQVINGFGRHEVIIDHSHHGLRLHEMGHEHLTRLLALYRERTREIYRADDRIRYVLVIRNSGVDAGASLPHPHSQIIGTPLVPESVQNKIDRGRRYHREHGGCLYCALIDEAIGFEVTVRDPASGEIRRRIECGQYVIEKSEHFIAVKPFASRYEWEVHLLPLNHEADFTRSRDEELADFARLLGRTMERLDRVLEGAQYNYFLHSRPPGDDYADCDESFHWHLAICPRTSIAAGFELGTDLFVCTVSPEEAASRLRAVALDAGSRPEG